MTEQKATTQKKKPGPKKGQAPPHIALKKRCDALEARVEQLEALVQNMLPPEYRALTREAVAETMLESKFIEFEVLADFKIPGTSHVWKPGRRVRAADYSNLLDLIGAGLKLGVPRNQKAIVAKLKEQAQAQAEAAAASAKATEAAQARAQADADAAQAAAARAGAERTAQVAAAQ